MKNPISKFFRYIKREQMKRVQDTFQGMGVGGGIGSLVGGLNVVIGTAFTGSLALPLAVGAGIAGGAAGLGALLGLTLGYRDPKREDSVSREINGYTIVGSAKDLNRIALMQGLVERYTDKLGYMKDVPVKVQRKIARHIDDIAAAVRRVRFYKGKKEQSWETFPFLRNCVGTGAEASVQPFTVPEALTFLKGENAQMLTAKAVALPPPAPKTKKLPAPGKTASDFSQMTGRVEKLERKIDGIENPPSVRLDKPGQNDVS